MFDNILLPIDLNHESSWKKALPMAMQLAGAAGKLHLLGVVHDLGVAMIGSYLPADFEKTAMERLKADLQAFADREVPAAANATVHVGHGHVPQAILRVAEALGADVIVMASHPPHDLQTMLVGSYADKVVRHAEVPVLVVR